MAVSIIMGRLTHKDIENAKGMAERDRKAEQIIRTSGGKLIANYYTLGRYDFVSIIDLPSTEALTTVLMKIGKWGTVSTETLVALKSDEVYKAAMSV